jgi:hypothetical protein
MSRPSEGKTENSSDEGSRMKWKVSPWKIKEKDVPPSLVYFTCCELCTFILLENAHVLKRHVLYLLLVGWWPSSSSSVYFIFYIRLWWSRVRWNLKLLALTVELQPRWKLGWAADGTIKCRPVWQEIRGTHPSQAVNNMYKNRPKKVVDWSP